MRVTGTLLIGILAVLTAGAAFTLLRSGSQKHFSAELLNTYARWKVEHGKLYATPSENQYRLSVFADQLNFVQKSNADYEKVAAARGQQLTGPMFEMNMFGDLTEEEFTVMHTGDIVSNEEFAEQSVDLESLNQVDQEVSAPAPVQNLGAPFVPRVRNQGSCGSCWAFSAIVEFEKIIFQTTNQYVDLSHQELVDCVTACGGCNGGASNEAYNYVLRRGGMIQRASAYPYRGVQGSCQNNMPGAMKVTGISQSNFQLFSFDKARQATSRGVLATVSVYASGAFRYFSKTDDVFDARGHAECGTRTGHAIVLMSFNGDVGRVLNSWGTGWGVNGYKNIRACDSGRLLGSGGRYVYPYNF